MNLLRSTIERISNGSYIPVISIIIAPDKKRGNYSIRAEYFDLDRTHIRWFYIRGFFNEETRAIISEGWRIVEDRVRDH